MIVACALGFAGAMPGCTYSKDYFRIGADGKKIKADGPILPGEDTGGFGTAGTSGATTGGDGTITPTAGTGTGGTSTGGTTGGISGTPVYPLLIQTKDESDVQNLFLTHFSQGAFLEAPKAITQVTDDGFSILFPALSPDASSVIYSAFWYDSTSKQTKGEFRKIVDLSSTPSEATWNAADPGLSPSWRANGQDVVYTGGGCGLLRKSKADGTGAATEVPQATGDYDKWVYMQTSVAPTTDTSNPTFDLLLFSMFSADTAPKQGFDLFARKLGDADPAHISRVTNTPTTIEFYPSVSPDGKYVLFGNAETSSPDPSSSTGPQKIAVCDLTAAGGAFQCGPIRTLDAMAADAVSTSPCWSWDGTKVFFVSKDSTHKLNDVYVVDFAAGNFSGTPVNITNTEKADDLEISCASAPLTK